MIVFVNTSTDSSTTLYIIMGAIMSTVLLVLIADRAALREQLGRGGYINIRQKWSKTIVYHTTPDYFIN